MGVGSDSGAGTKNGNILKFKEWVRVPIHDTYREWVRVRDLEQVPVLHRFLERL